MSLRDMNPASASPPSRFHPPTTNHSAAAQGISMRIALASAITALTLSGALCASAQVTQTGPTPPKTWVDKDTGHRVFRLTDEPGSSAFYFNVNAYSPDNRYMIYTAPDGIHTREMATRRTRLLVPNPPRPADAAAGAGRGFNGNHAIVVGHK